MLTQSGILISKHEKGNDVDKLFQTRFNFDCMFQLFSSSIIFASNPGEVLGTVCKSLCKSQCECCHDNIHSNVSETEKTYSFYSAFDACSFLLGKAMRTLARLNSIADF